MEPRANQAAARREMNVARNAAVVGDRRGSRVAILLQDKAPLFTPRAARPPVLHPIHTNM
jgi:hypothetical protein